MELNALDLLRAKRFLTFASSFGKVSVRIRTLECVLRQKKERVDRLRVASKREMLFVVEQCTRKERIGSKARSGAPECGLFYGQKYFNVSRYIVAENSCSRVSTYLRSAKVLARGRAPPTDML
jgi:hypothetical protein